jgi:hypothetical protein
VVDAGNQMVVDVRVHGLFSIPTTGVIFSIGVSEGFTGTLVSYEYGPEVSGVGNPSDGFGILYNGGCSQPFLLLARLTYQLFGSSSPCSTIEVLPYPGYSSVMASDCTFEPVVTARIAGPVIVNPNGTCPDYCFVSTERSTWGRIKALYR